MYEMIETVFKDTLNYAILVVEVIGVVMLLVTAIQALFVVFKSKAKCRHMLGDGISTALSFLLASEVMKTIIAPDWSDIGMTCAILVMRAGMTVLIHWENAHEPHED